MNPSELHSLYRQAEMAADRMKDAPAWQHDLVEQIAALPGTDTDRELSPAIVAGIRKALAGRSH